MAVRNDFKEASKSRWTAAFLFCLLGKLRSSQDYLKRGAIISWSGLNSSPQLNILLPNQLYFHKVFSFGN